jgi:hypothetical protein
LELVNIKNEPKVKKGQILVMNDLLKSLLIINDCLQLYGQGKTHHILPISGQLRALLLTTGRDKQEPLLFRAAKLLSYTPILYYFESIDTKDFPFEGSLFSFSNFTPTIERISQNQQCNSFENWLLCEAIQYENRKYSFTDLIREYSDTAGGAHYDPDFHEYFAKISSFRLNGISTIDSIIITIAKITLLVGINLLRLACNFELTILLAVNSKQTIDEKGCVFQFHDPNTLMGFYLLIDSFLNLHFNVMNIDGGGLSVTNYKLIDWSFPHIVSLTYDITCFFETELVITIDGEEFGKNKVNSPIFTIFNFEYYNRYFNCDSSEQIKSFEFGLGFISLSRFQTFIERTNMLNYICDLSNSRDNIGDIFYDDIIAKGYRGSKDIIYVKNNRTRWSLDKLALGELPNIM